MKIAIDARFYGLEHAGLGRYTIHLIEELAKLDSKNEYHILLRKKYANTLRLPDNFKKITAEYHHYTLREQIGLVKTLNNLNPDITHFPHLNVPYFYERKYVVTIHDLIMHKRNKSATTLSYPVYLAKRIPYKIVSRNAVFNSSQIITPSSTVKDEIVDYYKINSEKIKPVYEGYSEVYSKKNYYKEVLKKFGVDGNYFIYTGNAYPHKNLELAVKAIKRINSEGLKVNFLIGGSRDVFKQRLEKLIPSNEVTESVKLLGYVEDKDLRSLYHYSDGFLFPSFSEGFGLPGVEAMAAGTVVLASEIPVFKEVYSDNAQYFNPYQVNSLVEVMKKVLNMSMEERGITIKKSQKFIQKYSWTKMAKEILKIYTTL
jgi:glycosyltransferase involved in cell wall biosynthesis